MINNKSFYRPLITLILAALLVQPAFAAEEKTLPDAGEMISGAAYEAALYAGNKNDDIVWKVTASGEPVKSGDGVMVSPAGDPGAEAPELKARGAALYSFDLDRIVYGKNENTRLEPYSTTKLLTCWLAIQNLGMNDIVTVSKDATQAYENGTTIWLKEGEKITVRDLLYGAMLESGNDAAYALGEAVAGSEVAFAELMNNTAIDWGCKDTHFVNANGWKNEEHYTTPHDMAIITAKCLESAELRKISTTKKYTAPATNMSGEREMKNYLMQVTDDPDGLTGGKTGTWDDDDCAVVVSFSKGGLEAAAVVLGDTEKGRPEDIRKLMAFAHEVTPGFIVPAAGSSVEKAWVRHGEKTRTELAADAATYAYPASNDPSDIRTEVKYDRIEAPVKKGDVVGDFLVYADDKLIGEHKLIATEDIDTGWFPSYIYISDQATSNALKVLALFIALLILVSLAGRRRARKRKKKKTVRSGSAKRTRNAGAKQNGSRYRAASSPQDTSRTKNSASVPIMPRTGGSQASQNSSRTSVPIMPRTGGSSAAQNSSRTRYSEAEYDAISRTRSSAAEQNSSKAKNSADTKNTAAQSSRKSKREARKRLRDKYRDKH